MAAENKLQVVTATTVSFLFNKLLTLYTIIFIKKKK